MRGRNEHLPHRIAARESTGEIHVIANRGALAVMHRPLVEQDEVVQDNHILSRISAGRIELVRQSLALRMRSQGRFFPNWSAGEIQPGSRCSRGR